MKNLIISILDERNPEVVVKTQYPLQFGYCDEIALSKLGIVKSKGVTQINEREYSLVLDSNFDGVTYVTLETACFSVTGD